MREGWKCPACHRINAPHIDACPCSEGSAGVPAVPLPASSPFGGGVTVWPTAIPGTTVTVTGGAATLPAGTGIVVNYSQVSEHVAAPDVMREIRKQMMRGLRAS